MCYAAIQAPTDKTRRLWKMWILMRAMSNYLRGVYTDVLCEMIDFHLQVTTKIAYITPFILEENTSSDDELQIMRPIFDRTYTSHRSILDMLAGHPGREYQSFRSPSDAFPLGGRVLLQICVCLNGLFSKVDTMGMICNSICRGRKCRRGEGELSDEDPNLHVTIGERIQGEAIRHDIAIDLWNARLTAEKHLLFRQAVSGEIEGTEISSEHPRRGGGQRKSRFVLTFSQVGVEIARVASSAPSWLFDLAPLTTFPSCRIGSYDILIGSNNGSSLAVKMRKAQLKHHESALKAQLEHNYNSQ
ncbi:hypothetical protein M5K25_023708 [Dendrobium thyrsiflorum]|uniref:Uncharacterized protein n=1 Tax=Dendrobium thyrsiflorum TaxID=117978 RepID=A0ABD0TZY8_DENTH